MARILLIDDDVDIVEMYEATLRAKGNEVVTAYTAQEARKKLAAGEFDAVVLDVMMETVDAGFQLGRDIHEQFPDMPILFLSSIVGEIDETIGIPNTFEADGSWLKTVRFLDKPVTAEVLIREVAALVG